MNKEGNVVLYAWDSDYDPWDVDTSYVIGLFETYEEAIETGNYLKEIGDIYDFDTYVN